ncbi:hypothetical protein LINPERHAP2_LOCUS4532 [Linum perenne]
MRIYYVNQNLRVDFGSGIFTISISHYWQNKHGGFYLIRMLSRLNYLKVYISESLTS